MANKKVIISILAATVSASSLVAVNAADKIDLDINKEVNESNSLIFGDFFGPKYTLNDKKAQKKLAEILDSIKGDYYNSESRIKTYDFIIEIDNYEIGLTKDANDNGYYILSFIRKDSPHNFNTYKTKVNIYSELMKVLNSSDGVNINLKNLNKPGNKDSSILAIGGDQTIASDVYSQLSKKKVKLDKIAGKDRFDTSVKIVKGLYPESASYICISDKYIVKDIVTSVMSVKYQKPIVLEKNPYSFIENRDKNMYIVFK